MIVDFRCSTGKLQLTEDGIIQVNTGWPMNKLVWQMPAASVTRFTTQPGLIAGTLKVTIHYGREVQVVDILKKKEFEVLLTHFPGLSVVQISNEWYDDMNALTHVATYTKQKDMQKEIEIAYSKGWVIQGQSAVGGHVNVGNIIAGGVLFGPAGAILGSGRSKDKTTLTFVRTPEWLAQQKEG